MSPNIIREFWCLIEATQTNILLELDDASLVRWLVQQFARRSMVNSHEVQDLDQYISVRIPLIRDIAQDRQFQYQ
ncbi:hypothetical protein GS597_06550 [Synechococcales cyanobacterium C]|uniref:Uncharacterized protein n=1 Tax=Petrachloros mirabilis ULC683 TaxID=2781853 RepID=A0A8K1ZYH6_9CYAN|nr:hypothetical protein [Petrachloros mirabilis]NCJ06182.1 hypothetical protein [Petrachloros mirabilis ULC683]